MDVVKVVPINHCEICPFGVIKDIMTNKPKLFCQRSNKFICDKPVATKPPEWCELTDLEDLVLKNRHEVIKIIEKAYGPLHVNPWDRLGDRSPFSPPKKTTPWKDTVVYKDIYKRYWMARMKQAGKEDPTYEPWLKSLTSSSTKAKKSGRKK